MGGAPVAGRLLALGSALFILGAANPALFAVWSAPVETQLRLIHDAETAWIVTNVLFLAGTVLTAAGLWLTPDRVGNGGLTVARVASVAYLIGATSWLASLVFRLTVTPHVASSFVNSGSIDSTYTIVNLWAVGLFGAFTYLAGGSLVTVGVAVILGRAVPAYTAWFAIVIGAGMVVGYAIAGDMPPFVAYLPTGLLGIALMRQRMPADADRMAAESQVLKAHPT
jgi:cellulose synthase/poly-beta-1,6-N-acetylglucosamine synthase-like glycosyltransferase